MELTGKAEELFIPFVEQIYSYEDFIDLPDPMKWGVYEDFFDSVGVTIIVNTESVNCWWVDFLAEAFMSPYYKICKPIERNTRQEARIAAIEKANKIVNNR